MSDSNMSIRLSKNNVCFSSKTLASYLMYKLHTFRQEAKLCDVSFALGDGSKTVIPAHACVLMASSSLFSDIFTQHARRRYIQMKDFDEDVLNACLDYMYGQDVQIAIDRIQALKTASVSLRLKYLTAQCSVALETITNTNEKGTDKLYAVATETLQKQQPETVVNIDDMSGLFAPSSVHVMRANETGHDPEVELCFNTSVKSLEINSEDLEICPLGTGERNICDAVSAGLHIDTNEMDICGESTADPDCDIHIQTKPKETKGIDDITKDKSINTEQESKNMILKANQNKYKRNTQDNERKEFTTFLRKHKRVKCDHCDRTFAGTDGLNKHKTLVEKNSDFKPRFVYKTKEERQKAKNINRIRYENKEYTCKDCGMTCFGWSKYNVHRRLTHSVSLVCQYCSKIFAWPHSLKIHEKRHEQAKNFVCSQCNFRAVCKSEVEQHEQRMHSSEKFPCSFCSAVFKCELYLKKHELNSHVKDPSRCPYCDYTGSKPKYVEAHIQNKHFPENRKLWPCSICSKEFTRKSHMDRHLKDVHREQPTKLGRATVNRNVMRAVESATENELRNHNVVVTQGPAKADEPILTVESQEISAVDMPMDLYFIRDEMGNLYRCDNMGNLSTLLEGDIQPSNVVESEMQDIHGDDKQLKLEGLDY